VDLSHQIVGYLVIPQPRNDRSIVVGYRLEHGKAVIAIALIFQEPLQRDAREASQSSFAKTQASGEQQGGLNGAFEAAEPAR